MPRTKRPYISFAAFFILWAEVQGWTVPLMHVRICNWLESERARVRVLQVFRGAAKSTIYAVYKAWMLYSSPEHRSLVWGADDAVAGKLTRDTLAVLRRHPLCKGMIAGKPGAFSFWVEGATDARNASMEARGISSNATASRCDDADFDDVEVPRNIRSGEARTLLRQKLAESTHILVPGGRKTYIGTPHTVDSIYSEQIVGGAASLRLPMFAHSIRYEDTGSVRAFDVPFDVAADGLTVIAGIGKPARVLEDGIDYHLVRGQVAFFAPPVVPIDICTGNSWPERFTREEVQFKRKECLTFNEWDSQYQLAAKPIIDSRLKPERMRIYDVQPSIRPVNGQIAMFLGDARIVGAAAYWDCSLGKINSDASVLSLILTDAHGSLYWHVAAALTGELSERDARHRIVGGQVHQVREIVLRLQIPRVEVETNGPGGFVPAVLREALRSTGAAVGEVFQTGDKRKRILDAFEAPLSGRFLWAHADVASGPAFAQMRDFNPAVREQPDDYIDSAAGAISATPVRIGRTVGTPTMRIRDDWRPTSGVHVAKLELPGL